MALKAGAALEHCWNAQTFPWTQRANCTGVDPSQRVVDTCRLIQKAASYWCWQMIVHSITFVDLTAVSSASASINLCTLDLSKIRFNQRPTPLPLLNKTISWQVRSTPVRYQIFILRDCNRTTCLKVCTSFLSHVVVCISKKRKKKDLSVYR